MSGKTIIVKFKQSEQDCIKFIENQDNYSNVIKYLIMKEIHENGQRNLNKFIPSCVSDDYFKHIDSSSKLKIGSLPLITNGCFDTPEELRKRQIKDEYLKQEGKKKKIKPKAKKENEKINEKLKNNLPSPLTEDNYTDKEAITGVNWEDIKKGNLICHEDDIIDDVVIPNCYI